MGQLKWPYRPNLGHRPGFGTSDLCVYNLCTGQCSAGKCTHCVHSPLAPLSSVRQRSSTNQRWFTPPVRMEELEPVTQCQHSPLRCHWSAWRRSSSWPAAVWRRQSRSHPTPRCICPPSTTSLSVNQRDAGGVSHAHILNRTKVLDILPRGRLQSLLSHIVSPPSKHNNNTKPFSLSWGWSSFVAV